MNVWGAVTAAGLGPLVRLDGRFNGKKYCELIEQVVLPYALDGPFKDGLFYFQHDLSPIHTCRDVKILLHEHAVQTLSWPPKGADMNPIENVWGVMKGRLARLPLHTMSCDLLWDAVYAEWERLRSTHFAKQLLDSMPRRMAAVVDVQGEFTKY